jgi:hypothetical protein
MEQSFYLEFNSHPAVNQIWDLYENFTNIHVNIVF